MLRFMSVHVYYGYLNYIVPSQKCNGRNLVHIFSTHFFKLPFLPLLPKKFSLEGYQFFPSLSYCCTRPANLYAWSPHLPTFFPPRDIIFPHSNKETITETFFCPVLSFYYPTFSFPFHLPAERIHLLLPQLTTNLMKLLKIH